MSDHDRQTTELAEWMLDDKRIDDRYELLELLAGILAPTTFAHLCAELDACPRHVCDLQVCADDQADCETGRAAWEAEQGARS